MGNAYFLVLVITNIAMLETKIESLVKHFYEFMFVIGINQHI